MKLSNKFYKASIEELRNVAASRLGVTPTLICMVCSGRILKNLNISDYSCLQNGSTVMVVVKQQPNITTAAPKSWSAGFSVTSAVGAGTLTYCGRPGPISAQIVDQLCSMTQKASTLSKSNSYSNFPEVSL